MRPAWHLQGRDLVSWNQRFWCQAGSRRSRPTTRTLHHQAAEGRTRYRRMVGRHGRAVLVAEQDRRDARLHRNEPAASALRRKRLKGCNLVRWKSRRRAENISDGFSTGMTRSPRPIWSLALNRGLTVRTAPNLPMIATVAQGPFHGSGQLSFIRDLSNPEARP
jgi:hypothetical protein